MNTVTVFVVTWSGVTSI